MKPRYRVTSTEGGTPFINRLIQHAIKFQWWVTKDTPLELAADAYTVSMGVRLQTNPGLYEIH